jgi:NAD+ kinase
MKIAIFSKQPVNGENSFIHHIISYLIKKNIEILIYEPLLNDYLTYNKDNTFTSFKTYNDLINSQPIDYLFSLGGDGTFLDAANLIKNSNIPIVGINTGRIGFLTGINKTNFEESFSLLEKGDYEIEERILLMLSHSDIPTAPRVHYALNDITIRPCVDNTINTIHVWVNEEKVNTYWADGLIVATPTGSTAYSLSCGGPIIVPSVNVLIITPIASHSLAVRPIVIPDDSIIKIIVENRNEKFSLALDSYQISLQNPVELTITKGNYTIKTVRFPSADFYSVIREKLLWGIDIRNTNPNS